MSSAAIILIVIMLICLFIGVPISWSLMIASAASVLASGIPASILCQRLFTSMDAFTMLAVPLFLVAGDIMAKGSISKRLVDFADSLFGHMRGGMAVVAIVASTIFAALTGSALATTAAIGAIMYPAMTAKKYPKDLTTAVLAIGGTLGPVIPPSVVFIFYAQSTDLSVVDLFMSGVGPGLLSCLGLSIVAVVVSIKMKLPKEGHFDSKKAVKALKNAFFALLMPLIILGGIYSGVFTATESAGIAVVYGLIVSVFIYKDVKPRELLPMFKNTAKTTANLMVLIASANVFGYLIGYFNIPRVLTDFVQTYAHSQLSFLLICGIILLICGMFMEAIAVVVILAPILAPMAASYGINAIQFGCFVVFLLCLGIATPPFAPSMFVACGITKEPVSRVTKKILPFIFEQIFIGVLIALIPAISIFLPNIMK